MKRIFSVCLCIILTACLFVGIVNAASTNLVLEYKAGAIKKGETVKVSLLIENNTGFGTAIANIGFNKANLELKSINKTYTPKGNYTNIHLDGSIVAANKNGKVKVGYTPDVLEPGVFTSPITYNGVLAELTFVALKDCTIEAYFVGYELYLDDMNMTDVPCTTLIKKTSVLEPSSSNIATSSKPSVSQNSSNISSEASSNIEEVSSNITANTPNVTTSDENNGGNNQISVEYLYILLIVLVVATVLVVLAIVIKKANTKKK